MTSVQRESLSDQVARLLLERVRAREWEIGQKLPGETTLAPQFGVGRSTVREAIRRLSGQGVLSTRQGAGVFVQAVDPSDDWDALLMRAAIVSILEARTAVECEAAALAADRHTRDDMVAIRAALALRGADRITIDVRVDTDTAFHRSIVVASRNEVLVELFDAFAARSREAMIRMLESSGEPGTDHDQATHRAIVDAIEARDARTAGRLSRAHLDSLRDGVSGRQEGSPSRPPSASAQR